MFDVPIVIIETESGWYVPKAELRELQKLG